MYGDTGSQKDQGYLNVFLEYVPGGSVASIYEAFGALPSDLVKHFVHQTLIGLHYLHERDIMHRDIKGANVLVDTNGQVKISDFGISKVEECK